MEEENHGVMAGDLILDARARLAGSVEETQKLVEQIPYPAVAEPMLVHPHNNSIVKIRDNGTVDLFTGTDNGIRINPENKTLDLISKTENHHSTYIRNFVLKNETHHVNAMWTIYADKAEITTKKDTTINTGWKTIVNAEKNVEVTAKEYAIVNANKDIQLNSGKKMIIKSKGNIELNTDGEFILNAKGNAHYNSNKQHFFD